MTNPGFQPYLDLTSAASAAGGPARYLLGIRSTSLAVGAVAGALGVVTAESLATPARRAATRRWLVGQPGREFMSADGKFWYSTPAVLPGWRRRKPKPPLGPEWRNVGYTEET